MTQARVQPYRLFDFRDSSGTNVVNSWLHQIELKAKVKYDKAFYHIRALHPGETQRPYIDTLTDECSGLIEIRIGLSHIEYRLLGFYGPGPSEITFVFGAIERSDKLEPKDACEKAMVNKELVRANPRLFRVEHDYS